MDARSQLTVDRAPGAVLEWVDDLCRYPTWMRLVHAVEVLEPDVRGPAWRVELRARLGPFARSKRLRMVRTTYEPNRCIVFERAEDDGREHAPWVLTLTLGAESDQGPTDLEVHLHYGGTLWTGGVLERVLADEVERGRNRLLSLLQTR